MKPIFGFIVGLLCLSKSSFALVDPASLVMNVYTAWISPSQDCSSPLLVFDSGGAPKPFDMLKAPTLGGGNPPDGTYPCLILKMSSVVTVVPATTEGSCIAGQAFSHSICRADNGGVTTPIVAGNFVTDKACVGAGTDDPPTDNKVFLYLSTGSTLVKGSAFQRPTIPTNGIMLGAPFVVNGASAGTFVVSGAGAVNGSGARCKMNTPTFSFR